MTTLMKKRERNRLLNPRYERMFTPWSNNFFPFGSEVRNLLDLKDPFIGDFLDVDSLINIKMTLPLNLLLQDIPKKILKFQ